MYQAYCSHWKWRKIKKVLNKVKKTITQKTTQVQNVCKQRQDYKMQQWSWFKRSKK